MQLFLHGELNISGVIILHKINNSRYYFIPMDGCPFINLYILVNTGLAIAKAIN